MKTFNAKSEETKHNWYVIDATDRVLGRLATEIARRLRGKHKPEYTPHVDTGDFIVVVNTDKLHVTGNKMKDKVYYNHSGKPGHLKVTPLEKMMAKDSREVIEHAVRGMLPKNPLGRAMFRKLKLYKEAAHPHQAQQPHNLVDF